MSSVGHCHFAIGMERTVVATRSFALRWEASHILAGLRQPGLSSFVQEFADCFTVWQEGQRAAGKIDELMARVDAKEPIDGG